MGARVRPKATILVIDDERIVHDSVRRILEEEGYLVTSALRVEHALDLLSKESFDIALTDLMMPDESGMLAVQAIARDHPHTGVVMFTGYATVESAVESMKLGALDYLPKPFTPEELVETIEKALAKTYKLRRDREIERAYTEAEKAIRSSLDLKEILNLICTSVTRLLQVKGCALYLFNKRDQSLELVCSRGLSADYLEKGVLTVTDDVRNMIEEGKSALIDASEFTERLQYPEAAVREGIGAMLSIPLTVEENILGALRIYADDRAQLEDRDKLELLEKFADQSAKAIENAMEYEKVRSDIEQLTKDVPGLTVGEAKGGG